VVIVDLREVFRGMRAGCAPEGSPRVAVLRGGRGRWGLVRALGEVSEAGEDFVEELMGRW
jgi:hypothetical protein